MAKDDPTDPVPVADRSGGDSEKVPKVMSIGRAIGWSTQLGAMSGCVGALFTVGHNMRGAPSPGEVVLVCLGAVVVGGVIGFAISPLHALALRNRPESESRRIVGWSTLGVLTVSGYFAGGTCVPLSIFASVMSAIVAGLMLPRILGTTPGVCTQCEYQVRELAVCPECGTANAGRPQVVKPPAAPTIGFIIALASAGVVVLTILSATGVWR